MNSISVATGLLALLVMSSAAPASAEPVAVRFSEGVTRGFPVLRSVKGEKLAQGELTQVARDERVESRLVFRFFDGSYYEEQTTFAQHGTFRLLSYRLVQRGPSFPETVEASMDRETARYSVRYRADDDSPEEILEGTLALPLDVYNGMLTTLIKNLPTGTKHVVQIVAFTPKPRLVRMSLAPVRDEPVLVGDWPLIATRYRITPQLGLFASLLVTDIPDVSCWILGGEAPGFVRFEGPLYFMGPVWRIEPN